MKKIWPYLLTVVLFLGYSAWIAGPYLRSTIVRDAAVTSWTNIATAPIDGTIVFEPIGISSRITDNGLLARIENKHTSREAFDDAALQVALAKVQQDNAQEMLDEILSLEDDRRLMKSDFAEVFRSLLDTQIGKLKAELQLQKERLEIMKVIAGRKKQLAERGAASKNASDEEALRVNLVELEIKTLQADMAHTIERREAADVGVFIDSEGDDPDWVRGTRMELKLEKKKARMELWEAEIKLKTAQGKLADAEVDYKRRTTSTVTAPAGHLLWRKHAVTGMTVSAGMPVAEWIDCNDLLVDMPVSDAEASLVSAGAQADIILEGEKFARAGKVLLVRGSAATLGRNELAALAKGRREGLAQVVLKLDATEEDFDTCPVGRAAYVDFKGVGILDVLRARLRL